MGTSGLIGHIIRGRKRACYNNKDSYPSCLGIYLVEFILSLTEAGLQRMKEMVERLDWIEDGDDDFDLDADPPTLDDILRGRADRVRDDSKFDGGVCCEWTYYIDWDRKEVFVGGYGHEEVKVDFASVSEEWMESLDEKYQEE